MIQQSRIARFGIKITTVDPTQGYIGGVMKGDAQERQVLVATIPQAFRWPQVGEDWMVEQKNGTWYLDTEFNTNTTSINTADPGDVMLIAPTGVVRVLTNDEDTDFIITKPEVPRVPPFLGFYGQLLAVRIPSGTTTRQNHLVL